MADEARASQQSTQQGEMLSTAPMTLGVLPKFYAQRSTTLIMKPKTFGFSGKDYVTVKDMLGAPVFQVRAEVFSLSHRVHVLDNEGQHLFTIRKELPSFKFDAYAEDPQGNRFFDFHGEPSFGNMENTISFINAADGRTVQLKMKVGVFDKIIDIRMADSDTVIARIERSRWGSQKFVITIAPNVDVSLVVAMCICLLERIRVRNRARNSGGGFGGAAASASASASAAAAGSC